MSTMIRPTSLATVPGRLLGARQLGDLVRRVAASPSTVFKTTGGRPDRKASTMMVSVLRPNRTRKRG